MSKYKDEQCCICGKAPLEKDEVGACKKLLGRGIKSFFCIDCLATFLEVTPQNIREKIEEFKEDGCALFK